MTEADGGGAYESTLYECVLRGNSAARWGGGTAGGTLYNCTLDANHNTGSAGFGGGGAAGGTLYNCLLTGNSAAGMGGGANYSTLYNSTVTGNSAAEGGGIFRGTVGNCIVYSNQAATKPNYSSVDWEVLTIEYSCTTPLPEGPGNIDADPRFVNATAGDFRLLPDSPCINAGLNAYSPSATDFDGNPRIVGGTVDMGAYECQSPALLTYYTWMQDFGLPTDSSAAYADSDSDGHNNWQEWRCLTHPTNALSVLRLLSASPAGTDVTVSWQSVEGVSYFLERSTNLEATPPFTLLAPSLPGQPGMTSFSDTNAASHAPLFYRVGVSQ